ncbi:MAG: HAD family hydrolase [Candidatus Kapaibacterium sp.]
MIHNIEIYKEKIIRKINPKTAQIITRIEESGIDDEEKIAVFDLDGTLIEGDIGDAIFCFLISSGYSFDFKWSNYQDMLAVKNYRNAYIDIVTTMKGMDVKTIVWAASALLKSNSNYFDFEEDGIKYSMQIPKPIPEMQYLLTYLKLSKWKISVISASSHIAVRTVCDKLFKLKPDYIRGIKTELEVSDEYIDLFTDRISGTVTYREGKAVNFRELFGNDAKPIITAGDSHGDIELLNLTPDNGLVLICSKTPEDIDFLRNNLNTKAAYVITGDY